MKSLVQLFIITYYFFAVLYAFIFWGVWWGILNLFIPFAPFCDFILKMGRIV